jgi:CDGSH-type Zn-finger protein
MTAGKPTARPQPLKRKNIMSTPVRASDTPFAVNVEQGKDYFWCACGQSKNQPFCDGSHKGGTFAPVKFSADASKQVYFCGCKASGSAPLCDGSHKNPV